MNKNLLFVSFEKNENSFKALLPFEDFISLDQDYDVVTKKAISIYTNYIQNMQVIVSNLEKHRNDNKPIPARLIWDLGNEIFTLKEKLEKERLQIDDMYIHLIRDLLVNRKWLEKVITFRRYLPKKEVIPASLNWGKCEKGTRRKALEILDGKTIE